MSEIKEGMELVGDLQMRFTKRVKAPRSLVWKVHTDPILLKRWWGPEGFSITTHAIEMKNGGIWKFTMHRPPGPQSSSEPAGADGADYPNTIWYKELREPEFMDYDHGDFESVHFHVHTEFIEEGDYTKIVSLMSFKERSARDETAKFAVHGHASTMLRLESLLKELQS